MMTPFIFIMKCQKDNFFSMMSYFNCECRQPASLHFISHLRMSITWLAGWLATCNLTLLQALQGYGIAAVALNRVAFNERIQKEKIYRFKLL